QRQASSWQPRALPTARPQHAEVREADSGQNQQAGTKAPRRSLSSRARMHRCCHGFLTLGPDADPPGMSAAGTSRLIIQFLIERRKMRRIAALEKVVG